MFGRKVPVSYTPEGKPIYDQNPLGYAHEGDAAMDLRAVNATDIEPGDTAMVGTGIMMAIPSGCVGLLFIRSGIAVKKGIALANSVGVIDSSYRGEIVAALTNQTDDAVRIASGERIAQIMVLPYCPVVPVFEDSLDETSRGADGFGSTGTM